jgi:hypothetical protein
MSLTAATTSISTNQSLRDKPTKDKIPIAGGALDAELTDDYLSVFGGSNAISTMPSNTPLTLNDQIQSQQLKLGILFQTRQLEEKVCANGKAFYFEILGLNF